MDNYVKQFWTDATVDENGNVVQAGTLITAERLNYMEEGIEQADSAAEQSNTMVTQVQADLAAEQTARVNADAALQTTVNGKAAISHNHSASDITSGILPVTRGGTGVTTLTGTDYTTNRVRGIILQASTPTSISNGCIVGVYS